MADEKTGKKAATSGDAFSSVAAWQFMSFILLLCFVWASELMDLPALLLGVSATPFSLGRACMLSVGIITAGIITVGHTYERQKAVIRRMLMTCVYCHRVMHQDGTWEHVEEYFIRNYPMEMDKGACPSCETMLKSIEPEKKDAQV